MTKRKILPSSMHTPWAGSNSYNLSELNTIQGGVASPCLSSSLPFCVRFNRALRLASQPYSQAATLDTKPLAKSYLGGSRSHWSSTHFQYARAPLCSLLSDSIRSLLEHPSGFEHEVLDRFPVALWYPIVSWRASKPSPRLRHPSPARGRGAGGEGVTHCACDEGIGLGVDTPRDGYRV